MEANQNYGVYLRCWEEREIKEKHMYIVLYLYTVFSFWEFLINIIIVIITIILIFFV